MADEMRWQFAFFFVELKGGRLFGGTLFALALSCDVQHFPFSVFLILRRMLVGSMLDSGF